MVMLGMVKILDLHGFTILLYNNCIYIYIYMCSKQSQQTIPASSNPHLLLVFVCEVKVHGSGGEFGCFFFVATFRAGPQPQICQWRPGTGWGVGKQIWFTSGILKMKIFGCWSNGECGMAVESPKIGGFSGQISLIASKWPTNAGMCFSVKAAPRWSLTRVRQWLEPLGTPWWVYPHPVAYRFAQYKATAVLPGCPMLSQFLDHPHGPSKWAREMRNERTYTAMRMTGIKCIYSCPSSRHKPQSFIETKTLRFCSPDTKNFKKWT